MRGKMVEFDRVKLQAEIGRRGLTPAAISREMGSCNGFMGQVIKRGTMRIETLNLLKEKYNISFQDIQHKEPEPPKPEVPTPDITLNLVAEAVFRALVRYGLEEKLYNAMRRALSE